MVTDHPAGSGPVNIAGPIRLSNSKLTGFDLGSKLSAISKLSGAKTGADTSIPESEYQCTRGPGWRTHQQSESDGCCTRIPTGNEGSAPAEH